MGVCPSFRTGFFVLFCWTGEDEIPPSGTTSFFLNEFRNRFGFVRRDPDLMRDKSGDETLADDVTFSSSVDFGIESPVGGATSSSASFDGVAASLIDSAEETKHCLNHKSKNYYFILYRVNIFY